MSRLANFLRLPPIENPLVHDTFMNRVMVFTCKKFGCITIGRSFRAPQATCARCGGRNWCAASHVKKWRLPDDEFLYNRK